MFSSALRLVVLRRFAQRNSGFQRLDKLVHEPQANTFHSKQESYMSLSEPKLISFKLCPFVQRAAISLLHRKVDFDIEYIDLFNKPDWFLKISPFGRVPVLLVDDTPLFESAVINEYLNEIYPPTMHPEDPLLRAQNRAWIEFGSAMLMTQFRMYNATDAESFEKETRDLHEQSQRLEAELGEGPFFNGQSLSLVDTTYAPIFMRYAMIEKHSSHQFFEANPKVKTWGPQILALESVQKSVVPEFEELFIDFIKSNGGYLAQNLV